MVIRIYIQYNKSELSDCKDLHFNVSPSGNAKKPASG